jgi:hypothetical protein
MTADDVLSLVMSRLGGGMPVVDITTELTGVLKDLSGRADFLTAQSVIETAAGQSGYSLSEDCKDICGAIIYGKAMLDRITYERYLELLGYSTPAAAGTPSRYAIRHGKIWLWPVPDAVYEIRADCSIYHPETFTEILFGSEFTEAVVHGVLAALYAGQLKKRLSLAQRTLAEREELTCKFYEQHPEAKFHADLYEMEIDKLAGNLSTAGDTVAVEYRDI